MKKHRFSCSAHLVYMPSIRVISPANRLSGCFDFSFLLFARSLCSSFPNPAMIGDRLWEMCDIAGQ